MGVLDFEVVFDILDPARHGFLTAETVREYDELLHTLPLDIQQVRASIRQLCGGQKHVSRQHFVEVLQDLERRRAMEEQLRWDFMALDQTGSTHLPLKDGLMLFTMAHGYDFSMQTWNLFLQDRGENKEEDVYFDEIKIWLCDYPEGPPATQAEILQEQRRLQELHNQKTHEELERHLRFKEDEIAENRQRQEHNEKMRKLARRKMNKELEEAFGVYCRWEEHGVEALLFDDGLEHGDDVTQVTRRHVGLTEITEALQTKYDLLRKKLFWDMLQRGIGEAAWTQLSDSDRIRMFQQLQHQERQMRDEGFLDTQAVDLTGAQVAHAQTLTSLIGEIQDAYEKKKTSLSAQRMELLAGGKTEQDIDRLQRDSFEKDGRGPVNSVDMLVSLDTRYLEEKDWILNMLRYDNPNKWSASKVAIEYCSLTRQHMVAELEPDFLAACLAVGTAERPQEYKPERFDPDRHRHETLASYRLKRELKRAKFPYEDGEKERDKHKTTLVLTMDIVKEVLWKHLMEREILIEFLIGPESEVARSGAKHLSDDQRAKRLTSLRNQRSKWREYSKGYRTSQRNTHLKILLEGTAIYWMATRQEKLAAGQRNVSDADVSQCVLADLQQKHDVEMGKIISSIQGKSESDLLLVKKEQRHLRKEGVYDTVAMVVLGTTQVTQEDRPFLEALEAKYSALRQLLFTHLLRLEHGVTFFKLPEPDRQKLITKKIDEEEKLRQEGNTGGMAKLIDAFPREIANLRLLMGEDRAEYNRRLKDIQELTLQAAVSGKGVDKAILDEKPVNQVKAVNLLADLISRAYSEEDAILAQQRAKADISVQEKLVPLVMLRLERMMAVKEEQFDIGATSIGLLERILAVSQGQTRHAADARRQQELARMRVESRRARVDQGRWYRREPDEGRPEAGDTVAWMEAYVREMVKKHREEREIMISVFQDASFEELYEAAKSMSNEEKHKRLAQLQAKRHKLDLSSKEMQDENISIIEEAAAIRFVLRKQKLESLERKELGVDAILAHLLCDVQTEQDAELSRAVAGLGKMDIEDLSTARSLEMDSRHRGCVDNVLHVLTRYEGAVQDSHLLQALESKYDAVREQLLMVGLRGQHGESAWAAMSVAEQQTHIAQATMQHRQLLEQRQLADLARLLGNADPGPLHEFLGQTRPEYETALRLMQADDEAAERKLDEEESKMAKSDNPFELIFHRCEREKQTLLDQLKGTSGRVVTELDRHTLLARYMHEARCSRQEVSLPSAALALGLTERQQANLEDVNTRDRRRQEQLAEIRIQTMASESNRRTSAKPRGKDEKEIVKTGDRYVFLDAVLSKLRNKHQQEVEFLLQLSAAAEKMKPDQIQLVEEMSEVDRQKRLAGLEERRSSLPLDKSKEQHGILQYAFLLKRASRTRWLAHDSDAGGHVTHSVMTSLLADLQRLQDMETESFLQLRITTSDMVRVQEEILYERKCAYVTNVATVLLEAEESPAGGNDQALVQTLQDKYDALRDKILAQALIAQMGENEFNKLSEEERQRRMLELRLREKRLRKEGRYDEAAALLGEAFANQQSVDELLGIQREEHERRMRERLALRQQRLAEGFSEEECDKLDQEEEKEYRKKRNLLADLEGVFEKEKEELLRSLAGYRDKAEAERRRQLEIARLKREQRRLKEEEKFSAAALFISVAKEQEKELEQHRKKQEQLARERLNEKLRLRKQNLKSHFKAVPHPQNAKDVVAWQEAVAKEMELKHADERFFLMSIMKDPLVAEYRERARDLSREGQGDRLEELRMLRRHMREGGQLNSQEHIDLLREATALRLELLYGEGRHGDDDERQVALLADLQEEQDAEMAELLDDAADKSAESLKQLKLSQEVSRKQQWNDNLAAVVLDDRQKKGGATEEREVLDELEKKYDMVLDKLLEQALRNKFGEGEWENITPQEKQQHLVKLKLQNRKLRAEGKMDEANELLGGLLDDDDVLRQLGASKSQQREEIQERLQRKRELMAERQAKGLSTDDAVLEAILEQEGTEQPKKKRNVLEQLQLHFDDEKEALLAALRSYQDQQGEERQRQLQVARLKREQKRLQMAERYEGAATLIALANEQGKARDAFNASEKERMKMLAKEKLEARRRNMQAKRNAEQELLQEEQERQTEEAKIADSINAEGEVALQASVLIELQIKQDRERDKMADIINEATALPTIQTWINNMKPEERKFQLEKLRQDRGRWRHKVLQELGQPSAKESSKLSDADVTALASMRDEQQDLMVRAVAVRIAIEKEQLRQSDPFLGDKELEEEIQLALLTDLQHKQGLETNAVSKLVAQQNEGQLRELKDTQVTACREGWYDNLSNVLFDVGGLESLDRRNKPPVIVDSEEVLDKLDSEYETERAELIQKMESEGKSSEEIEAECEKLREKYDNLKAGVQEVKVKQQTASDERWAMGQQAQADKQYEEDVGLQMARLSNREASFVQKTDEIDGEDSLSEKIAQRREQRKQAMEDMTPPPSSAQSERMPRAKMSRSIDNSALFGAMKREKTVLDVAMSDEQIAEKQKELLRNMAANNRKMAQEQRAHEDRVQARIREMKEKRQRGVDEIFSNMERQRTTLEKKHRDEKERQTDKMRKEIERRARSKSVERGEILRTLKRLPDSETQGKTRTPGAAGQLLNKDKSHDERMGLVVQNGETKQIQKKNNTYKFV